MDSGTFAAVPQSRASDRDGRRRRLIRAVRDAGIFANEAEQAQALFVADAIVRRADGDFIQRYPADAFPNHVKNNLTAMAVRQTDEIMVSCSRPKKPTHGYDFPTFLLETCMTDQPFIIDTIKLVARRMDLHTVGSLNMILPIERDQKGQLLEISQDNPRSRPESVSAQLLSIASVGEHADEVRETVLWHLQQAQRVVADFRPMRRLVRDIVTGLRYCSEDAGSQDLDFAEAIAFNEWLLDENFVFMGAWGFDALGRPTGRLGLGRYDTAEKVGVESDPREAFNEHAALVSIHQSRKPSPIHREAPLVEVRLRLVNDDGTAAGGVVLAGLFTYRAVTGRTSSVPFLRRRLARMVATEDLVPSSHRMKLFLSFFDRLPLAFAFAAADSEIVSLCNDAIDVDFGSTPRVVYRVDALGNGAQVFVLMNQERYGEEVCQRIEEHLKKSFRAEEVQFRLLVGKTDTAILDYLVFADTPLLLPDVDLLTDHVSAVVSPWLETMREMLRGSDMTEAEVDRLCLLYGESLPPTYHHNIHPRDLVDDLASLEAIRTGKKLQVRLRCDASDQAHNRIRMLVFSADDIALTDLLPVVDNFGVRVLGEASFTVHDGDGGVCYFQTYGIAASTEHGPHLLSHSHAFVEAMYAVMDGRLSSTTLNRLLLPARLSWRQLQIVHSYLGFARQLGTTFPNTLVQSVLLNQPESARTLIDLFDARFSPYFDGAPQVVGAKDKKRSARVAEVEARLTEQLQHIQDALEDKVLRMFVNFITATLRTNYFQRPDEARGLSFKFRCSEVEIMPEPRPMFEIFVYDPRVEGIHLRGGPIARGGIRWSDRIDDFRTEILSLMQTQMVKNTLIVPVGSKGGFVLKKPERDEQARRKQADDLYKVFINGLLDVTDNLVSGKAVPPEDVVVYDGADPYLVVAADKGTAHLSDTANGIALSRGFWLGDAFASGGSVGYDHKKYGITAKGGWVCVQRHFREIGIDTQTDEFRAFGIGDMSGDVFGNGLLLTKTVKLVAAFDHRHIFIDPNPDPAISFVERQRLFDTPRSSWAMYDEAKISKGGGIFPRGAKSIALTPEMQKLFGTHKTELTSDELLRMILLLDCELFWNGGIGTFVKSSAETNHDVGDKTNDAIRVDANELRCKVIGEGGNLGFTHAARVEFALKSGRINTDAVDNSAGVDMSDHEVNLKILFAPLLQAGKVDFATRNAALFSIDQYVCDLVLWNNYQQSLGISVAELRSSGQLRVWGDTVKFLVDELKIDQDVQLLPSKATFSERRKLGMGLMRPELARITAFAKMWLFNALAADKTSSDRVAKRYLEYYFPKEIRDHYQKAVDDHMLRHEIISTLWANELVDFGTAILLPRLAMEYPRPIAEICQAHTVSIDLLDIPRLRKEIIALDGKVPARVQYEAFAVLDDAAVAATQWLLASFPGEGLNEFLDNAGELQKWLSSVRTAMGKAQTGRRKLEAEANVTQWTHMGLPSTLAETVAGLPAQANGFAIWSLGREMKLEPADAVAIHFATAEITGLAEVLAQVADANPQTRWEAAALASLGPGIGHTLFRLASRVAQSLAGRKPTHERVRAVLVDELKLGALWDLAHQIQAEGVQIPALVVLTERLRARLR
jgi:glutamate dehydrogenase